MQAASNIIAGISGLLLGAVVGLAVGRLVRGRAARWFWVAAVALLAAGIGSAAYADMARATALWIASLGAIAGALTALKYGAGRTPGSAAQPPSTPREMPGWPRNDDPAPRERTITRH